MKNNFSRRLYFSTIANDAAEIARENGAGIEIAEFCTAFNMDTEFEIWDDKVRKEMRGIEKFTFHAPFNELCPGAIDPLIVEVARRRYEQAYKLMSGYGISKMIVHSGFVPQMYFENWFTEHSVKFWKEFLADKSADFELCLENTLENSPEMLCNIVKNVNDKRFKLCLDVGHAAVSGAKFPLSNWIERFAPLLSHVHLHNNFGEKDTHNALCDGKIDVAFAIRRVAELAPTATFTIETSEIRASVDWLKSEGLL
ncbi:MAG: sugar phosphate isomerase/epimerase [Oscillospiraceae bacterium]|nr:sugar phosphate isomerase/epimerase [Oscillospiraceae bacterium]